MTTFSGTGFDFSPGAQVPLTDASQQNAATQMLASAAYRDDSIEALAKLTPEVKQSPGHIALCEANLGEAFSRAVQLRMLGAGRKQIVPSFGADPATVVENCLAASSLRRERDARLTAVMAVFGLLFLPGTLTWLGAFQLRRILGQSGRPRGGALGTTVLGVVVVLAAFFLLRPPFTGVWQVYARIVLLAPVVGWFLAKRICLRATEDLRARWASVLDGGVGHAIPEAVPSGPHDIKADRLRVELAKLAAEQDSNVVFYAGSKGILGMGPRWGHWQMAAELKPGGQADIDPFRSWDVIRAIHDELRNLDRGVLHTGGLPRPSIRHWVVSSIGAGADTITRPAGPEVEGYTVKDFEVQRICNEQHFGDGPRHYLGVQFVLWGGQFVLTLLTTVRVHHKILRVEVSGYRLGPVAGALGGKPEPKTKDVPKSIRFWETKTVKLPLVGPDEVIRLAVRAPFTWTPTLLDWMGGKLTLPEPFGLRHVWAENPWGNRFMDDDALFVLAPVLRSVHNATIRVLEEHGVDAGPFVDRSTLLGNLVQGVEPRKADAHDM